MKPRATIIGAGISGLAAACLLAEAGWEVAVYEKGATSGGRAGQRDVSGYRFDTGPSWYLMPEVFEHFFNLLGETTSDHLNLTKLAPAYKVFYDDQSSITITGDQSLDGQTFEDVEPGAAKQLSSYLIRAKKTYQKSLEYFLYNPFTKIHRLARPDVMRELPYLATALTTPLHTVVARSFKSQKLQQILEYPSVFLGASPFAMPALYQLMSHLDFSDGVYYPQGGIYEIIRSIEKLARARGVKFHFNSPVTAIMAEDGRAKGVMVADKLVTSDLVVSAVDLHHTETKLLSPKYQTYPDKYWGNKVAGPSALLMYLGITGEVPELVHHNLLFVSDWRGNFKSIFKNKVWPVPASMYVCKPSATDDTVAPSGDTNLFVLVPLPAGGSRPSDVDRAADDYIAQLAKSIKVPDLASRIKVRQIYGPSDFSSDFNAWLGTALGPAHLLRQSAFFRPGTRSRKLRNLMYVGASVQPGIGLPMCLISAEVMYKHLTRDHTAGPLKKITIPTAGWNI